MNRTYESQPVKYRQPVAECDDSRLPVRYRQPDAHRIETISLRAVVRALEPQQQLNEAIRLGERMLASWPRVKSA